MGTDMTQEGERNHIAPTIAEDLQKPVGTVIMAALEACGVVTPPKDAPLNQPFTVSMGPCAAVRVAEVLATSFMVFAATARGQNIYAVDSVMASLARRYEAVIRHSRAEDDDYDADNEDD